MSWFIRFDRFADTHVCFSQEGSVSCGLACAKMAVFKVNKLRPGASAVTSEAAVEAAYLRHETDVPSYRTYGAAAQSLADTLNDLRIGHWTATNPAANRIPAELLRRMDGQPVVMLVDWTGGGGHFVVADQKHTVPGFGDYVCVCDPADGNVHVTKVVSGAALSYKGGRAPGVNFWGDAEHNYSATGTVTGTVSWLIYCDTPPPWIQT